MKAAAITRLAAGTEVAYTWSRGHSLGDTYGIQRGILVDPVGDGHGRYVEWRLADPNARPGDTYRTSVRAWNILGTWAEHETAHVDREARYAAERAENEHQAARRRRWAEKRLDRLAALGLDRNGIAVNHATLRVTFAPKDLARLLELAEAGAALTLEGSS